MPNEVGTDNLELAQKRGEKTHKFHNGPQGEFDLINVGGSINLQEHQTLNQAQARQFKFYEKEQGGTLNSVFSTGQRVDVDVVPSGIQKPDIWIFRMVLQTTGGVVRIPAAPTLLNYLEIRPNQGQDTLGKPYGDNFFFNLMSIDPDVMEQLSDTLAISRDWIVGKDITTTPTVISFPILGQWLSQASSFFAGEFKDEVRFECTFRSDAIVSGVAANLQMTSLRIQPLFHAIDKTLKPNAMGKAERGLHKRYMDYAIHKETATLTAGADKTIELSGMTGKFSWLWVEVRPVGATGSAPFRNADIYYYPWERIGLEEPGGQKMLGGTDIEWDDFKNWWFPRFFPGAAQFIKRFNIGMICFAEDPNLDLRNGSSSGHHFMDGNQRLLIRPPSTAPVNASLTYTPQNAATSVASNPTGGTFKIQWKDPVSGEIQTTPSLAFNATAAAIQSVVYGLKNWMGVLNVTGQFDAGAVQFDFAGHYAGVEITESNLVILSDMSDGVVPIKTSLTASTAAVRGFTTGQYDIRVYGHYFNHLEIKKLQFGKMEYARHKE